MDADEIIAKSVKAYSTCTSYQDRGYAVFHDIRIEFSTLFKRPDQFYFHFQDYGPRRGKTEKYSTLWSQGGETVFQWVREGSTNLEVVESLHLGIARGVGCSAGSAGIIAGEILPVLQPHKDTFLQLENFRLDEGGQVAEIDCYIIKGIGRRARECCVWISKEDFSLRRFWRDLSSTAAEMNAEMKVMFENKELMAMLTEKGIAPPRTEATTDSEHITDYFYTEVAFDQEFEFPARPTLS
ncbi:MAG: hypothetical protein DKT66_07165 [Candidatus Melainabacteria bacterium]|nr:MAG: hypothetical protein DKT66_07165 [Candidatus Melainabacteria bacterium]